MLTLRRCSPLVIACDIIVIVLYVRLKRKHDYSHPELLCLLIQNPISVTHATLSTIKGGSSSLEIECWASDHWVAGSKLLSDMFHH